MGAAQPLQLEVLNSCFTHPLLQGAEIAHSEQAAPSAAPEAAGQDAATQAAATVARAAGAAAGAVTGLGAELVGGGQPAAAAGSESEGEVSGEVGEMGLPFGRTKEPASAEEEEEAVGEEEVGGCALVCFSQGMLRELWQGRVLTQWHSMPCCLTPVRMERVP